MIEDNPASFWPKPLSFGAAVIDIGRAAAAGLVSENQQFFVRNLILRRVDGEETSPLVTNLGDRKRCLTNKQNGQHP